MTALCSACVRGRRFRVTKEHSLCSAPPRPLAMGERIEDGGPAFPMLGNVAHNSDWLTEQGMSLRDWFAGQALPTLLDLCRGDNRGVEFVDHVAQNAYQVADAMLRARGLSAEESAR